MFLKQMLKSECRSCSINLIVWGSIFQAILCYQISSWMNSQLQLQRKQTHMVRLDWIFCGKIKLLTYVYLPKCRIGHFCF